MISPLDNLTGPSGSLHKEPPDAAEYAGLLHSAKVRLADSENTVNSLESRFDLAYNAAHAYCLAALRRSGVTGRGRGTSFFKRCPTLLVSAPRSGVCSTNPIRSGTKPNTKEIATSMIVSSPI